MKQRLLVKWVRDYIKKYYKIPNTCYICQTDKQIEFHHLYSLSELFHNWCKESGLDEEKISSEEEIFEIREKFFRERQEYLDNRNCYGLCQNHHKQLHSIFGQRYSNSTAPKVLKWINLQREKNARRF